MHYTMADLEQLVAGGQGSKETRARASAGHVPLTNLPSFVRDTRQEILCAVQLRGRMSRREIAEAVQLQKSGYVRRLCDELVSKGCLRQIPGQHSNGVVKYFYEVAR